MSERSPQRHRPLRRQRGEGGREKGKRRSLAVATFRTDKSVVDPERQSAFQLQQLG